VLQETWSRGGGSLTISRMLTVDASSEDRYLNFAVKAKRRETVAKAVVGAEVSVKRERCVQVGKASWGRSGRKQKKRPVLILARDGSSITCLCFNRRLSDAASLLQSGSVPDVMYLYWSYVVALSMTAALYVYCMSDVLNDAVPSTYPSL
jgi:hypothetical protein